MTRYQLQWEIYVSHEVEDQGWTDGPHLYLWNWNGDLLPDTTTLDNIFDKVREYLNREADVPDDIRFEDSPNVEWAYEAQYNDEKGSLYDVTVYIKQVEPVCGLKENGQ